MLAAPGSVGGAFFCTRGDPLTKTYLSAANHSAHFGAGSMRLCALWSLEVEPSEPCQGLPMKPYFLVFALIAYGAGLSVLAWPVPSENRATVAQVDLVALQQQANGALENLRRAQQSRQVTMNDAGARYTMLVPAK